MSMTVTQEKINECTVQLNVVADAAEVKAGFDKAYRSLAKGVAIPGFRKGAAPRSMIEPLLDPQRRSEEAAQNLVKDTLKKAIDESGLEVDPSTPPSVNLKSFDEEKGEAVYEAKVPLPPKVELGEYKGLAAERPDATVTDQDIEYQIDEYRRRRGTREAITDRGVQEGDVAVINLKADGEEGDGHTLMVVIGKTFEALDAALHGMQSEEIKHLELEFPESFQIKELAGTTTTVSVGITSLSAVRLPEIDDSFAKELQTENLEDLRARIKGALGRAKESMVHEIVTDRLLNTLRESSEVHVSDNMWESLAERRLTETAQEQAREGKSLEAYAKEQGMTLQEYVDAWRERAKFEIERALLIQQVFVRENMAVSNQDLNMELSRMAGEYQIEPEEMLKSLHANRALDELQFRVIQRKVRDFLYAQAVITDEADVVATEEGETPALEAPSTEEAEAVEPEATESEVTEPEAAAEVSEPEAETTPEVKEEA
ncbi:trigger factor [bacterium]|nr:MAG: trigger factor [bacterium]